MLGTHAIPLPPSAFPLSSSSPGWTRTTDCLLVRQLLLPLSHGTIERRLRELNPRPLRAAVFKTVSSTNRTVSFALSIKQRRPESNGLLLVQSESCEPLHYAASDSRRS